MNFKQALYTEIDKLVNIKNFDIQSFYYNFRRMVNNINKFHNKIGKNAKNTRELSRIQYDIPVAKKPKEGQVAYCFIEHSYPKEIFNSHWCLILKDLGNIMVVVPLTSIKEDSNLVDKEREMIIKVKKFEDDGCSKLKINQIFSADLMRIDTSKKVYDLQTDFIYIKSNIKKILNLD
ncbi:MAG: hypothetical protein ABF652_08140 [Clostridium beijerinckii]